MVQDPSLRAVLDMAAAKEAEAHLFYTQTGAAAEDPGAKALLAELAREEQGHQVRLETLDLTGLDPLPEDTTQSLRISEFLVGRPIKPDASIQDAMIYAMKREEQSEAFFADMADALPPGSLKQLFTVLRQEETQHKARLEALYDDVILGEN